MNWFEVDRKGLRNILAHNGPGFVLTELLQNAVDEDGVTHVKLSLRHLGGRKGAHLVVSDDAPNGFADLSHAWTLFAQSAKKNKAEKRGRFNMGEKAVLALCKTASITTTTGCVIFGNKGRTRSTKRTQRGSVFEATVALTAAEVDKALSVVRRCIPPANVIVEVNSDRLRLPRALRTFEETLGTVLADEDGALRPTRRKTTVTVYDVPKCETPMLYEMGIPVVEIDAPYWIDVGQKVPLNTQRDNVPPAWKRTLITHVLNAVADDVRGEEAASATWVTSALGHKAVSDKAVKRIVKERFGDNVASYDVSDREANNQVIMNGGTVLTGGALPGDVWANVKRANAVKPAGQIAPTPKPFSSDPDATPVKLLDPEKLSVVEARTLRDFTRWAKQITGRVYKVRFANDAEWRFGGAHSNKGPGTGGSIIINLAGRRMTRLTADVLSTFVHEVAHHYESSHLSHEYIRALADVGAEVALIMQRESVTAASDAA